MTGVATPKLLTCLEENSDFGIGHSVHSSAVSGAFAGNDISETCYLILGFFVDSLMFVMIFNFASSGYLRSLNVILRTLGFAVSCFSFS